MSGLIVLSVQLCPYCTVTRCRILRFATRRFVLVTLGRLDYRSANQMIKTQILTDFQAPNVAIFICHKAKTSFLKPAVEKPQKYAYTYMYI